MFKGLARSAERAWGRRGNGAFHREGSMEAMHFPREGGRRGPGIVQKMHSRGVQERTPREVWLELGGAASHLGTWKGRSESPKEGLLEDDHTYPKPWIG